MVHVFQLSRWVGVHNYLGKMSELIFQLNKMEELDKKKDKKK